MYIYDYRVENTVKSIDLEIRSIMRKVIEDGFDGATIEFTPNAYEAVVTTHLWSDRKLYSIDMHRDGNYGAVRSDKEVYAV